MRVGMSAHRFHREGGIERSSLDVAEALARRGVDMTLIAESVDPPVAPPLHQLPVTMPPTPGFAVPVVYPRRASRAARGRGFDILHNQGGTALLEQDVITAHSCHRAWWEIKRQTGERLRAYANPLHHAVLRTERRNYRAGAFSRVIAVSEGVGRELTRYYGVPEERIRVIPNAVDAGRFGAAADGSARAITRQRFTLRDEDFVLVFVGKEFRRKGLSVAVESLASLPATVKLLVVGGDDPGPYLARAAAAGIGDRVVFAGHSDRVEDFFAAGDAFVFPTLYEAFALVTLEAAAAGLPLVTTRVNGTDEFVRPGENGLFIDRTSASLAASVRRLVEDPVLTARLGTQARADVRRYTWDAAAEQTLQVYDDVLAERRTLTR